ncbi:MAG: FAD-binding oxidoreductase [Rhodothermaceae bacterium]|nr:FAD-binding oxidoreductase [Rhodothermaceae bacterium]
MPPTSCDVAVVGGGIMGAATAFWLRRHDPSLRVVVCEAETLAHGASGRNAGFLLLGTHTDYASAIGAHGRSRARQLWQFTQETVQLIRETLDGAAFDLALTGSLIAAGSPEEAERLRRSAELLAEDGAEAVYHDAGDVNRRIHAQGFHGALFVPEGGTMHPVKLVRHLLALSGATALEGARVTAMEPVNRGMRLVSERGIVEAGMVVLTLGAYLPQLVPEAAQFVRPVRAQMLATAPVAPVLGLPVYSHGGFFYLRQHADGRLLLGGARHLHEAEEVGYDDATTEALQADLEAYLQTHLPEIGAPVIERRWSGTMGFSPDGLPVVGTVPGLERATFATGFTGHGMGFSLRFGLLLANRVFERTDSYADLFDTRQVNAAT